ncbi:MAG: amidohydrolase family protein [Betaproteobacteria bacterium]
MHDLLIRGGTIVDGTGAASCTGDVAISDGKITEVGKVTGAARREIDAAGLLVAPGWVDIHTHYDGQASWDPYMTPSSWHGVTTAVMGNCGVGFAPAHKHQRQWMIELMEGVEDIPGAVLSEGVRWEWESFPEFLDALERTPRVMDLGAQIPHGALRVFVMGERGAGREAATPEDITAMARLAKEAVAAGAFGFTSSRTVVHRTSKGEAVPSLGAASHELQSIARAVGETGKGVVQLISDFDELDEEFTLLRDVARVSGRPLSFTLLQHDFLPDRWREVLRRVTVARTEGLDIKAQVACRAIGMVHGLECSMHPFFLCPSYLEVAKLPLAARAVRLRDPALRARILAEWQVPPGNRRLDSITQHLHKLFPIGASSEYEPRPEDSIAGIALASGRKPEEVAYDLMLQEEGKQKFYFPLYNYTSSDLGAVHEMMSHPATLLGLGDAGAHCGYICDASYPTYLVKHWARDRTRGPKFGLEKLVEMQTRRNALAMGMTDRGALLPGMKADINLIDFDKLGLTTPEMIYDLPAGGRRLVQRASGYVATLVSGEVVTEEGKATGALPGRLVRA